MNTTSRTTRRAFSLLELTLVLLIIGLLGAVAAVNLVGGQEKARIRTTTATMNTYKTQINIYLADKGSPPTTLQDLVTGKYIDPDNNGRAPLDAWKNEFYYTVTTGGTFPYTLISAGPDKVFETPDDIDLHAPDFGQN